MSEPKLSPIERFWRLLAPDSQEIRNIYIYAVFNGLISLSLPLGVQAIINLIQGAQISTSWIVLIVIVIGGIGLSGLLEIFQLRIIEDLRQKIFARAGFDFAFRTQHFSMETLYKHELPELMNRFFDVLTIQKSMAKVLIDFSSSAFVIIFSLFLLSFYHHLYIAFGLLLVIFIVLIFVFTYKKGLETSLKESKYKYKTVHWLEEAARTSISLKMAGKTELPVEKVHKTIGNYLQAKEKHFRILMQQYYMVILLKIFVAAGLLVLGGILVMEQQMNLGQFVATEVVILVVMPYVKKVVLSYESIFDLLTALEKVGYVTDLELEPFDEKSIDISETEGFDEGVKVEVQNVSFTYPGEDTPAVKDISLIIERGECFCITGPNNSGKSSLLYLLGGLYKISEGNILYNDLPIGNINVVSIRTHLGEQFSMLDVFEGTLEENITLGRKGITFEDLEWAVTNIELRDFIKSLPKGYNTMLRSQGKGLPQSIITKIMLARSIVNKPKLLLLEDTFEHLDNSYHRKIIDFLTDKKHKWTLIFVSSKPYFIKKADKIAVMKNGKIEHIGTFDEVKKHINF